MGLDLGISTGCKILIVCSLHISEGSRSVPSSSYGVEDKNRAAVTFDGNLKVWGYATSTTEPKLVSTAGI